MAKQQLARLTWRIDAGVDVQLRTALEAFLVWVLYPVWLIAGAADYFCHRRTDIAHTSGSTESWLHIAQFLCIGVILTLAVAFPVTPMTWAAMLIMALIHSALAFVDVAYTDKRRYISPLEQHVHGYLDVIPLLAVGLVGVILWQQVGDAEPLTSSAQARMIILGIFAVLAGVPVMEELIRTLRARNERGRTAGARPASALGPRDI